jgi:outer membrane protein assembly factor BamB
VAIADGLVYAVGYYGTLHCLDAETGQVYWTHEVGGPATASPLVADGKVYLGTARQTFWIFQAGKEKKVLAEIRMPDKIYASATAANGVVYIPTFRFLYAVAEPAGPKAPSGVSQ